MIRRIARGSKTFVRRRQAAQSTRRQLLSALSDFEHELEPGLWLSPTPSLAWRWGSGPLPDHLRSTIRFGREGDLLGRLSRLTAEATAGLPLFRAGQAGGRVSILFNTKDGRFLLFNRHAGAVARTSAEPPSPEYRARRTLLSRYLRLPTWSVDERGRLVEEVIAGKSVFDLNIAGKRGVFLRLVQSYEALIAEQRQPAAENLLVPLNGAARSRITEGDLRFLNAETLVGLRRWVTRWLRVPSHGDLSGNNIVVHDGRVTLIDLDEMCDMPFFFDLLLFVMRDADLARLWTEGKLEDDFSRLDRAARHEPGADDERSARVLLVLLVMAAKGPELRGETVEEAFQIASKRFFSIPEAGRF